MEVSCHTLALCPMYHSNLTTTYLDTVVTCFPQRWNTQVTPTNINVNTRLTRQKETQRITMDDTDVLQGILNRLDGDWRQRANTVWGLAEVIINYCAKNVLDSENMQGEEYQFMDFFSYSISNVVGAPSIGVSPKVQLSSSLQFYLQMNDQADKYAEFLKASERMKDLSRGKSSTHCSISPKKANF
jgi:hypothetical protein